MKPIVKWVGGKTQLFKQIEDLTRPALAKNTESVFYEPFCGGCAVSFNLLHNHTVINDINTELINMYSQIKENSEEVIFELSKMAELHNSDFYYNIRNLDRDEESFNSLSLAKRAARFLYLNHTCFNGLYRVNSKGYFNSPIGKTSSGKTPDIVRADDIRKLSQFLQTVDINCGSYLETTKFAKFGDVILFDPPYDQDPVISSKGFVSYTSDGWTREDLVKLKIESDRLVDLGCKVVITNNATEYVRKLFTDDRYEISEVSVRRNINRDGNKRTGTEFIIYSK